MPPKCTTGRQFPAIQSKGCTLDGMTKAEAARAKAKAKAAPAQAPIVRDTPLIRLQRNATRNIQLIREEMQALNINKRVSKALTKTNAAATRAKIIRRIKGARGRKHMAVH